jgi:phage baseplate assembly protein W
VANYSPLLPLTLDPITGYKMLDNIKDVVKQNFKMLILTNPGERIMLPDFGIGMYTFLFEQDNPLLYQRIQQRIQTQTAKYLPFITVQDVQFDSMETNSEYTENRTLKVTVTYYIKPLNASDVLSVSVSSGY